MTIESELSSMQSGNGLDGHERIDAPPPRDQDQAWPDALEEVAYQGLAGDFVHAVSPYTEADPAALLIQYLVEMGNIAGRTIYRIADGVRHYTNLFGVLVGPTATGRKGSARAHVQRISAEVDSQWADNCVKSGLSSGEGLIWAVRDKIMQRVPVKKKGRPTGDYDTIEADPGVTDKRLQLIEPEFASTLQCAERAGNILSSIIRQAWDSGDLRVLTRHTAAAASNVCISIIGHITPEELRRSLTSTEAANGYANRFLWVCVRRSKVLPIAPAIPAERLRPVIDDSRAMIDFAGKPAALWISATARLNSGIRSMPI